MQVRDAGLARELLAETFSEAWLLAQDRFSDPGTAMLGPGCSGSRANLVRRVYRDRAVASRGRARLGLPVAAPDEYGEVIERLAAGQTLGSPATSTSRGCRSPSADALELRVVQELDYQEIGQRLAITPRERAPVSSARSRLCDHRWGAPDHVRDAEMSSLCWVQLATAVQRDHRRAPPAAAARQVWRRWRSSARPGLRSPGATRIRGAGAEPQAKPGQVDRVIEENTIGLLTPDGSRKATVARTPNAALVAVATKGGGYCLIPSLAGRPSIGELGRRARRRASLRTYASPLETRGTRVWILYGRVTDDDAAYLDLRGVGLAEPVPLERGGFFLLELPETAWAALDNRQGPAAILDAGGRVLWTGCAWLGPAPGRYGSGNRWGMLGDTPDSCDQTVPPPVVIDTHQAVKLVEITLTHPQGMLSARRPGRHVARADHARETPASSSDSPTCARRRTAERIRRDRHVRIRSLAVAECDPGLGRDEPRR